MKLYKCHKQVMAEKITSVAIDIGGCTVTGESGEQHRMCAAEGMRFTKASPIDWGYVVKYADGYLSWSPTKAFEDGYECVEPEVVPEPDLSGLQGDGVPVTSIDPETGEPYVIDPSLPAEPEED